MLKFCFYIFILFYPGRMKIKKHVQNIWTGHISSVRSPFALFPLTKMIYETRLAFAPRHLQRRKKIKINFGEILVKLCKVHFCTYFK